MLDADPEAMGEMPEPPVYDTLLQVISLLQVAHLAKASPVSGKAMWESMYMPDLTVELAIEKLIGLLPQVEGQ